MISREQIEQLGAFDGRGARVLSLYLDLDTRRQVVRSYRIVFEDLVKEARERLDKPALKELHGEVERIQTWMEAQKPRGAGLALFSCTPRELWLPYFLPARIKDHLAYETTPDTAPLLDYLDEYERYAVALVNKEKARLFTVFMGEIEESDAFKDLVPHKTDQGGWAQGRYQRHHEAHVHWHLKKVVRRLSEVLSRRRFDRLIIAGPEEATSGLRHLLPQALASRLVAVVPADVSANERDILDKTLAIEGRAEREAEERVVHELFELAGAGGRAILGPEPTFDALWLGEVMTLVAADGAEVGGGECPNCGRLQPGEITNCHACGTVIQPVPDLLHRAMRRTLDMAGNVEVVRGDAARRLLEAGGGVGALLRYRPAHETPTGTS